MANKKHYIVTSITLGIIAASSAALIGLSNLATRDKIAQNEKDKINSGISEIYGKTGLKYEESAVTGEYKYVQLSYKVNSGSDSFVGYVFKTTGSNMYGKISLLVGFENALDGYLYKNMYVVVNEQTYASTLVDKYVDPVNSGNRDLDDVSCGATYGAKLVRDMVNEATTAAEAIWGDLK